MPYSYKSGKGEVNTWIRNNIPSTARVLDVGPGCGTYSTLLRDYFPAMDCCEIHTPYIAEYDLPSKYGNVYNMSITDFTDFSNYDFIIFGDILEHISVADTLAVLEKCKDVPHLLIAVPFECPQGAWHGVESERHLQADLTPEIFATRYPGFAPLVMVKRRRPNPKKGEYSYGYYIKANA